MMAQAGKKQDVARHGLLLAVGTELKGSHGRRWKIQKNIGQGQCCVVYKGTLVGEDTDAAVKVFKPGQNFAAACQREARLIDILHQGTGGSKHLVKKLDEFQYNQNKVLVTELLGDNLHMLLAHHVDEKMSMWMIQTLLLDILRSLEILHCRGFVHADIKPGNINWSPEEYCAKLIDYGLSFHVQDKVKGAVQSTSYRAPESGSVFGACIIPDYENCTIQEDREQRLMSAVTGGSECNGSVCLGSANMQQNAITKDLQDKNNFKTNHYLNFEVKGRRNKRGVVHHRPEATTNCFDNDCSYSNFTAADTSHSVEVGQTGPLHSTDGVFTGFDFYRHEKEPTVLGSQGSFTRLSSRHGVVHHRPTPSSSSFTLAGPSVVLDSHNLANSGGDGAQVGIDGLLRNTTFHKKTASGATSKFNSNTIAADGSETNSITVSNVNSGCVDDMSFSLNNLGYSPMNELLRVTKEVCNCVTCGRYLSCAIDMWSVGCLILQMFLGRGGPCFGGKLKCENCAVYDSHMSCKVSLDAGGLIRQREEDEGLVDKDLVVEDLRDLVQRCIMCHSTQRISVAAAISHHFFRHSLNASYRDMLLLPSRVLCLLNMVDDTDLENEDDIAEIEVDIQEECEKYGEVKKCILCKAGPEKSKVFVEYARAKDSMIAWKQLNGKTFNSRTVITCYFPLEKFHSVMDSNTT